MFETSHLFLKFKVITTKLSEAAEFGYNVSVQPQSCYAVVTAVLRTYLFAVTSTLYTAAAHVGSSCDNLYWHA